MTRILHCFAAILVVCWMVTLVACNKTGQQPEPIQKAVDSKPVVAQLPNRGEENDDRIKQMEKENAELKKKIAAKETQMPSPPIPPINKKPLDPDSANKYAGPKDRGGKLTLEIGEIGNFGTFRYKVEEVIDANSVLLSIGRGELTFLVKDVSTKGIVDDMYVDMLGVWEVSDTQKYNSKTYYLVIGRSNQQLKKTK